MPRQAVANTSLPEPAPDYDIFIIGGGINGAGIAADAAGRGLKVGLCEQTDLACATSSASSKLIHGGLRYLEHYEFRLVREALAEREILLNKAPHLIKPLQFLLPHRPHLRPAWMIRMGLFMYDHLSTRNKLAASKGVSLQADDPTNPLKAEIKKGFTYSDCRVDDARLVVANALAAQEKGASILVRTRCLSAKRVNNLWHITLENTLTGECRDLTAKALVNASGPWAQSFIEQRLSARSPRSIRLIKGSHFVVPKLYDGDHAYILQNEDQRIVFVIPYDRDFSLIGTTDKKYNGDPAQPQMDAEEEQYLLDVVNRHFKKQIDSNDIIWRYSGVRPLCDDESDSPQAMTRDYTIEVEGSPNQTAPLLSVFGGKLTTYRRLAIAAMESLRVYFPTMNKSVTESECLPGGDINDSDFDHWQSAAQSQYSWLQPEVCARLCNTYGSRIHRLLDGCGALKDLGQHFGAGLYEKEVCFLLETEWARTLEDVIWRRSKLGLRLNTAQQSTLSRFIEQLQADKEAPTQNAVLKTAI